MEAYIAGSSIDRKARKIPPHNGFAPSRTQLAEGLELPPEQLVFDKIRYKIHYTLAV
jgi:hypothetical protein